MKIERKMKEGRDMSRLEILVAGLVCGLIISLAKGAQANLKKEKGNTVGRIAS